MTAQPAPTSYGPSPVDAGVPWHLGDPYAEQRALAAGTAWADLSHHPVIQVTGEDRLAWLHLLLTQSVAHLQPGESTQALILSATGHIEHDLWLVEDGRATWVIAQPGTAQQLCAYLQSMVFMYRVGIEDVSADYAVLGGMGSAAPAERAQPAPSTAGAPEMAVALWRAPSVFADATGEDPYVPVRPARWPARAAVLPRAALAQTQIGAGLWAWEALRVAAAVPRLGFEIDHRTLPHEVGLIAAAVHLNKGCYRGQEAVARTINLGRPPRRLVLLHLDGTSTTPPPPSSAVVDSDGRAVGHLGTAVLHHEFGQVATAVVQRSVPADAPLWVGDDREVAASAQPVVVIS